MKKLKKIFKKKFSIINLLIIALSIFFYHEIYAAKATKSSKSNKPNLIEEKNPLATPPTEFSPTQWLNEGNLAEVKQLIHKLDRRAPSNEEAFTSPELNAFREAFFKVATANELSNLIEHYNKEDVYTKAPADLQFVIAQLTLLRPFRSFIQKIVPLYAPHKISRAFGIYGLGQIASLTQILLPTDQWQAGFDFVAGPPAETNFKGFFSITELQYFLGTIVYKEMTTAAQRLANLGKRFSTNNEKEKIKPFYFDQTLLYSSANFENDDLLKKNKFHFQPIGPAELAGLIAALHIGMHNLMFFVAYNRDDHFKAKNSLLKGFMLDSLTNNFMEGINDKVRVKKIKKYPNYMTLHNSSSAWGKKALSYAGKNLTEAVTYLDAAWTSSKNPITTYPFSLIRPLQTQPWMEITDFKIELLKKMVKGPTLFHNIITNDTVTVDLPKFYSENPTEDLKHLLPITWHDEEENVFPQIKAADGKKYNNYRYNSPKGWDTKAFEPWLNLGTTKDVGSAIRSLSQSWGGLPVALPLFSVIR